MKRLMVINVIALALCLSMLNFSVKKTLRDSYSLNMNSKGSIYLLSWPGILPDNKFYKIKVLRNKIIEKIILSPVKKVEFNLLMADKTIYSSKLLMEKGESVLAKDAALKGENYYSNLVQDYNKSLQLKKHIPQELDAKITLAAIKHQEIFRELEMSANKEDKKTFQIVRKFSKINYGFIVDLRSSKK